MVILENFVDNFSKTLENKICRRRYELLFIELISFPVFIKILSIYVNVINSIITDCYKISLR